MKKRLISLNLAFIMILTLLPFQAMAANDMEDVGYATYYYNNGTDGSTAVSYPYFTTSSGNLTLYEAMKKSTPAYENHVLTGFCGTPEGGVPYHLSDIIMDIFSREANSPAPIYAQWTEVSGNYIVYRCMDGKTHDGQDYIIDKSLVDGSTALAADSVFTNDKGQSVVAWETADDSMAQYAPGSTIEVSGFLELNAVMGTNYVTFHDGEKETFQIYRNEDATLSKSGRRSGSVFIGWNTSVDGRGDWYYPMSNVAGVPHDLYAQYEEQPSDNYVILECETGLSGGPMADVVPLVDGKTSLPSIAKNDQSVAYWSCSEFSAALDSPCSLYYPAGREVNLASGQTLTAETVRDGRYYGLVDGAGGLTSDGSAYYGTSCYVTSAGNLNLYSFNDLVQFTKDGAVVSGYTGAKTGATYSFNDDIWAAMGVEADNNQIATFTAQYENIQGDYIQYFGNGAKTEAGSDYHVQGGLDFDNLNGALFLANPFIIPDGQHFLGWNTRSDGRGDWYDAGGPISLASSSALYAQWGTNRVTYHYADYDGTLTTETDIDTNFIQNFLSLDYSNQAQTQAVTSLARRYGLLDYVNSMNAEEKITRLTAIKLIAALAELPIDDTDITLPFTDCDGLSIQEKAIVKAALDTGLLLGVSPDTLAPDMNITRAQMANLVYKSTMESDRIADADVFTDVQPTHWYYIPIMVLHGNKIIITDSVKFKPNANATLLDALRWCAAAHEWKANGSVSSTAILKEMTRPFFFEGWNTSSVDKDGDWYCTNDAVEAGAVLNLYEKWISAPENSYHYVLTGHRLDNGRMTNIVAMDAETGTAILPKNTAYIGWSNKAATISGQKGFLDEAENIFTPGSSLSVQNGDVFTPITETDGIFVKYHKNNDSATTFRTYYYLTSNASLKLYGVEQVFDDLPPEIEFKSWNTRADGSGRNYSAGSEIRDDLVLYAQWSKAAPGIPDNPGGTGSSSGGTEAGNTTATTEKNPDGSTTTTVTDKKTGTVTETTKFKDGSTLVVESKKDGTVTTTETAKNGVKVKTVDEPGEDVTAKVTIPKSVGEAIVTIPADVDYGTVAVDAKTGEVVKLSVPTKDGMTVKLDGSAELVLVDRSRDFTDTKGHWAEDAIDFATAHELFAGTSDTTFTPDSPMTRAMLMTVLARFDGQDTTGGAVWYEKAMAWAKENGISDGSNPNGSITREQFATMLWRYAGSPTGDGSLSAFGDSASVNGYAVEALRWAVGEGLISGTGAGLLAPQGNATRAQVATILMRFVESLIK